MKKLTITSVLAFAIVSCGQSSDTTAPNVDDMSQQSLEGTNGPPPPPVEQVASETTAVAPASVPAEIDGITNERLSFAPGTSSARVSGSITGYQTIDYLLNVRAGQAMNISMATKNTANYFNLLEPGETDAAIFNGSIGENMFEGVAAKSGDYRIRVYLYRNAARRNERADYILEAAVY
ncbi:MAG: hypothetical protein EP350_01295 [Alphaproteobacteria bacterium]|nr:MAG: hypothetical protein EP350_01295 [Alphaproteobacteria bacterium]